MFELMKVELTKLRKRRMTWILLGVMVAFYCLVFFGFFAVAQNPPHQMPAEAIDAFKSNFTLPSAANMIFLTAHNVGTLLLIILVASAVGNEYGWGTIRQVLIRKGIRWTHLKTTVPVLSPTTGRMAYSSN